MADKRTRGRPPVTTIEQLQEAAFELFMTKGYDNVKAEAIAAAAGASRASFFNYFRVKSDVFWVETDLALALFKKSMLHAENNTNFATVLMQALHSALQEWHGAAVPWFLTHFELIGSAAAVQESSATRIAMLHTTLQNKLRDYLPSTSAVTVNNIAAALSAVIVSTVVSWAIAGAARTNLLDDLQTHLQPIIAAYPDLHSVKYSLVR